MPDLLPSDIRARNAVRLQGILPVLAAVMQHILDAMESYGSPMFISEGLRTAERQMEHFKKGRQLDAATGLWVVTDPKIIVTNADGVVKKSNHQAKADGFGYAVDCAFLIDGPDQDRVLDTPSWDNKHPWEIYGLMGEYRGCIWGGRWVKPHDGPHLEWRG